MQQGSHLWSWLLPTSTTDPLMSGYDFQRISSPRNMQTSFGYKVTLLPPWWPSGQTNLHNQLLPTSLTVQTGACGSLPHSTRVSKESGVSPQPHFTALTMPRSLSLCFAILCWCKATCEASSSLIHIRSGTEALSTPGFPIALEFLLGRLRSQYKCLSVYFYSHFLLLSALK